MRTIRTLLIGLAALLASLTAGAAGQFQAFFSSPIRVSEAAGSVEISVLYIGGDSAPATIDVATFDITAIAGTHYGTPGVAAPVTATLSWGPNEGGLKTFSIPLINDNEINADRKFAIRLTNPVNGTIVGPDALAVIITSNDVVLGFEIDTIRISRTSHLLNLIIPCTGTSDAYATTWATVNGTAIAGTDFGYTGSTQPVTGGLQACFNGRAGGASVQILHDVPLSGDRSFTIVISPGPDTVAGPYFHAITVTIGDGPYVEFLNEPFNVRESGALTYVPVRLSSSSPVPVTVGWSTGSSQYETARPGVHYGTQGSAAEVTGTFTWNVGDTADKFISVGSGGMINTINNGIREDDRRLGIRLTNLSPGAAYGGFNEKTLMIQEASTSYSLDGPYNSVGESDTYDAFIAVLRNGSTEGTGSVTWSTVNGTAVAGADFGTPGSSAPLTGTITFQPGESFKEIRVGPVPASAPYIPIINDNVAEAFKSFSVVLSNPQGGSLQNRTTAQITIGSEDAGIGVEDSAISVDEWRGRVFVNVVRNGPGTGRATVDYRTVDGTALGGTHYASATGTLVWEDGDFTPKSAMISLFDDFASNASRSFQFVLSNATGAVLGPTTTTISLVDDDNAIQFSQPAVSVVEGTPSVTILVTRTGSSSDSAHALWRTVNDTAKAGIDFGLDPDPTALEGELTWLAGDMSSRTVTIPFLPRQGPSRRFTVELYVLGGFGAVRGPNNPVEVTIVGSQSGIGFGSPTHHVNESGAAATVSVYRSGPGTGPASITWTTMNGSASAGQEFGSPGTSAPRTGTLTWAAGDTSPKTITFGPPSANIPIIGNEQFTGDKQFQVVLSNPVGAPLGTTPSTTVTIDDDDGYIDYMTFVWASETGPDTGLTVRRQGSVSKAASVRWSTANGDAVAGSDFGVPGVTTQPSGILQWAAGDASTRTITVGRTGTIRILDDNEIEGTEHFQINFTQPVGIQLFGYPVDVSIASNDVGVALYPTTVNIPETTNKTTFFVSRRGDLSGAMSVSYATVNGTAIAGVDYVATQGTLSWGPYDSDYKPVDVFITNDASQNGSRTFTLALSNAIGGGIASDGSATVTIDDDDNSAQFTSAAATVSEDESLRLTITRTGGTAGRTEAWWTTTNGTATAGTDFGTPGNAGPVAGDVTWFPGDASPRTITIPIINNAFVNGARAFTVTLTSVNGYGSNATIGPIGTVTVTLVDDESAFDFASPAYTVAEGGALSNIAVNRSGAAIGVATVTWTTSNGTAVAGSDFGTPGNAAAKSGTLAWAAGETGPKNISLGTAFANIPVINDTVVEPSKAFTITLSSPTGRAGLGSQTSTTVTINDDDSSIQFSPTAVTVSEAGPNATLTVTRAGGTAGAASVTYTTAAGTATAGSDFTQSTGTLTWAAGDSAPKTVTVGPVSAPAPYIPIINDALVEGPETFTVVLSAPTGASLGATATATVTIDSDDKGLAMAAPALSVAEGAGTAQVSVVRTGPPTGVMSVNYATANGTAAAPAHYTATTGTLTWADGDAAPKTISVPIIDNAVVNTARTFNVTLSGPVGATLGTPVTTTVTINDDDNTLQFSAATAAITEANVPLILTVTRSGGTGGSATVTWTTADGSALGGTDFGIRDITAPVTGMLSWAAGDSAPKTFAIAILDDGLVEGAKSFTVTLSSPLGPGAAIGAIPTATITLNDNDSGAVFANSTYFVNENGGNLTVTVNRIGPATAAANVTWTTANGTAISGTDFGIAGNAAARTGVVSWAAGDGAAKTFTIPILNDAITQGTLTFTIALSAPSAGLVVGTPATTTVSIVDDEGTPPVLVEFSASKYVVREGAGPVVLTVTRTGDTIPVTVSYATASGTASSFGDFTTTTGTLTWAAGDTSPKTITVPIANDAVAEATKQFTVTLSAPSAGAGLGVTTATVLIEDDDEGFPPGGAIPVGWVIPASATTGWNVSGDPGAFEGTLQLRSGTVYDGETAGIEVSGNYQAGNVTFRYKVSSELNFDFLRFFVDGVEAGKFSGTAVAGWTLFSTPVTAGSHTFRWVYGKDASGTVGADAAWIDAVTLPAAQ